MMTLNQQLITIAMAVIGTLITRALPFVLFPAGKETPEFIKYLGKFLPGAVFAMLVVYCFKGVSILTFPYGLPEIISICFVVILHLWKRQMLISITCGTVLYMVLVQTIF